VRRPTLVLKMAFVTCLALTCSSCPPGGGGTFDVYVINLTGTYIDGVSMKDQGTGSFVSLLENPIPTGTLFKLSVSKNKYQTNSGSIGISIFNTAQVDLYGRVLGPGPVVVYSAGPSNTSIIGYDQAKSIVPLLDPGA